MTGWLQRYREGQEALVWHELRQLGARVREPAYLPEAQAVCDEMAHRARRNLTTLIARLEADGFRFHSNDDAQTPEIPFFPATDRAEVTATWLEDSFEAVPLALLSWLRIVGDVWLVGSHPVWTEASSADPLVLDLEGSRFTSSPIVDYFEDVRSSWAEDPRDPFVLPVSPDHLHKANVSGGEPYGVVLPDATAESTWSGEVLMPFVGYLDWVFRNGGFPLGTGETDDAVNEARWRLTYLAGQGLERL